MAIATRASIRRFAMCNHCGHRRVPFGVPVRHVEEVSNLGQRESHGAAGEMQQGAVVVFERYVWRIDGVRPGRRSTGALGGLGTSSSSCEPEKQSKHQDSDCRPHEALLKQFRSVLEQTPSRSIADIMPFFVCWLNDRDSTEFTFPARCILAASTIEHQRISGAAFSNRVQGSGLSGNPHPRKIACLRFKL